MIEIVFTEEKIQALNYQRYHHPHPRVQRKMEALGLKSQKVPHKLADVSVNVVTRYLREYKKGGIERLMVWENGTYISSPYKSFIMGKTERKNTAWCSGDQ